MVVEINPIFSLRDEVCQATRMASVKNDHRHYSFQRRKLTYRLTFERPKERPFERRIFSIYEKISTRTHFQRALS